jgi:hypothetical protein
MMILLLVYKVHLGQGKGVQLIAFQGPMQLFAQGDYFAALGPY